MNIHANISRCSLLAAWLLATLAPALADDQASDPPAACTPPGAATLLTAAAAARTVPKAPRYTQGLLIHDGTLYEGAGMWGHSGIYASALDGSQARNLAQLDADYFGEGIAIHGEHAYFLTYQAGIAYRYSLAQDGGFGATALAPRVFSYEGQGWGLASDGEYLLFSDGSAQLRVIRPADFSEVRRIDVRVANRPLRSLNELEVIGDHVFANVYGSNRIAIIRIASGCVDRVLDATPLVQEVQGRLPPRGQAICSAGQRCSWADFVLNGIAYDAAADEIYLTGKNWPTLFVFSNPLQPAPD